MALTLTGGGRRRREFAGLPSRWLPPPGAPRPDCGRKERPEGGRRGALAVAGLKGARDAFSGVSNGARLASRMATLLSSQGGREGLRVAVE